LESQTIRCTAQGNIELVPEKQVLDLNSAPQVERVDDKHHKQVKDALILPHCVNPPRRDFREERPAEGDALGVQ
jgi:hypothetical protein